MCPWNTQGDIQGHTVTDGTRRNHESLIKQVKASKVITVKHPSVCPICKKQFPSRNGVLGHIQFAHRDPLADELRVVMRQNVIEALQKVLEEDGDKLLPETKAAIVLRMADLTRA